MYSFDSVSVFRPHVVYGVKIPGGYFGTDLNFLMEVASEKAKQQNRGVVVELGVRRGLSLVALALALPKTWAVIGYDIWKKYKIPYDILAKLEEHIDPAVVLERRDAILGGREYAKDPVSLLHVDLCDDKDEQIIYDAVRAWLSNLRMDATLIGHDYAHPKPKVNRRLEPVRRAIARLVEDKIITNVRPSPSGNIWIADPVTQ